MRKEREAFCCVALWHPWYTGNLLKVITNW
jgi:hypothetical protein